jgi:hypothetical protein
MNRNITLLWIEAGKKLAVDPEASVKCPVCDAANLSVRDQRSSSDTSVVEREMRCPSCGAINFLRLVRPVATAYKINMTEPMTLRCISKIMIGNGSMDFDLHVLTPKAVPITDFEGLCEVLNALMERDLIDCQTQIELVTKRELDTGSAGLNAYSVVFGINYVHCFNDYAEEPEEPICVCTLTQLKVAVETYLRFLQDPERKPITVPFPDH